MRLQTRIPTLLDDVDDAVALAYGGWPDRLYLVGRDGRVAFQGGRGPDGFRPEELEAAIEAELAPEPSRPGLRAPDSPSRAAQAPACAAVSLAQPSRRAMAGALSLGHGCRGQVKWPSPRLSARGAGRC